MDPSFERYVLWHSTIVGLGDVKPYMTDAGSLREAVNAYLVTREDRWLEENPKPVEAKHYKVWLLSKLNALYPDYQFLIDGHEVSTEEAMALNIFTWNIKLQITYDEELSKALEEETV